jgi:hypothetical protein
MPRASSTPVSSGAPDCTVLAADPSWFIDPATGEAGVLQVDGVSPALLASLLALPPLSQPEAAVVASTLGDMAPAVARPAAPRLPRVELPLMPVLHLSTAQVLPAPWGGGKALRGYKPPSYAAMASKPQPMSHARLGWRYGKVEVQAGSEAELLYPDVFVTCHPADLGTKLIFRAPTVVIEVLSPSTQAYDRSKK